jgi:CRP-like cAMP-binding protein
MKPDFEKRLIQTLEELSAKVDALIQVVAITSRREKILKGKTKTDQIVILSDLGLSRKLIALIVGTTPGAVRARLSELKAKKKEAEEANEVEDKNDE